MKKMLCLLMVTLLSTTAFAATFTVKTPSSNTVLKFNGSIISNTNTVNITTDYFPSTTLTKEQLIDLQNSLSLLGVPKTTTDVRITVTLDASAIQILKNAINAPLLPPSGTGTGTLRVAPIKK